jgi:hypothetical protein
LVVFDRPIVIHKSIKNNKMSGSNRSFQILDIGRSLELLDGHFLRREARMVQILIFRENAKPMGSANETVR